MKVRPIILSFALAVTALGVQAQPRHSLTQAEASVLWFGANSESLVSGSRSEQASIGGKPGIGHPGMAAVSDGGEFLLAVTGLRNKMPEPTRVLVLNVDLILERNNGQWPDSEDGMAALLEANPDCVIADVQSNPREVIGIAAVPKGTRAVVLVGAEALDGDKPPPSQALLANRSQFPPYIANQLPVEPVRYAPETEEPQIKIMPLPANKTKKQTEPGPGK